MTNSADPDQLASSEANWSDLHFCKGRGYTGSAGPGLSALSYHTCHKISTSCFYYLLTCLKCFSMSGKQCRPWSDRFCGIWSGSTLFERPVCPYTYFFLLKVAQAGLLFYYYCTRQIFLTLVLLNPDIPAFNRVDPDQLASEEANWSGSTLFATQYWIYINNLDQGIWLADN